MSQMEEAVDLANIRQINAYTIRTLVDAGFNADTVVDAVMTNDLTRLKRRD